jgi:hypothetical protein
MSNAKVRARRRRRGNRAWTAAMSPVVYRVEYITRPGRVETVSGSVRIDLKKAGAA